MDIIKFVFIAWCFVILYFTIYVIVVIYEYALDKTKAWNFLTLKQLLF